MGIDDFQSLARLTLSHDSVEGYTRQKRYPDGQLATLAAVINHSDHHLSRGKIVEAHKRLAAALEHSKEIYGRGHEKAVDEGVHEHPYQATGVGR